MIITDAKTSFILYTDYEKYFRQLTDSEAAAVLFAVFAYASGGEEPEGLTPMATMVFSFIRDQLDRDMEKYRKMCERNRKNGASGGRPKKTQSVSEKPTETLNDNDNDTDNDNETDTDIDTDTDNENERRPEVGAADFEEFWREYPKHVGRKEAMAAYFEAVHTRDDAARLMELLGKWKRSEHWKEEGGKWIRRADKFLVDVFPTEDLPPNYEVEEHWNDFFEAALRRSVQYGRELTEDSGDFSP